MIVIIPIQDLEYPFFFLKIFLCKKKTTIQIFKFTIIKKNQNKTYIELQIFNIVYKGVVKFHTKLPIQK
ncbi:hypothetical protein BpHYR1_019950 [Brachionus plicatilis]|uniref:Uncharacterized protein n=1 Tax=Brachionus plicatilis TaxID=10195 RepID=A0A3M7S611_BRAPC|nr:hypothetical protein BpHYR1_019950 [Brachionus plicatilis]